LEGEERFLRIDRKGRSGGKRRAGAKWTGWKEWGSAAPQLRAGKEVLIIRWVQMAKFIHQQKGKKEKSEGKRMELRDFRV